MSNKVHVEHNTVDRVPSRAKIGPAWLKNSPVAQATSEVTTELAISQAALELSAAVDEVADEVARELAEERAAIQAEADLPADSAGDVFPPEDDASSEFDDWIIRTGANGCQGIDRPGQRVADRWWERISFDDLPTLD